MDNFQYSVQLSDQDWAEFSATADECGLLQAGLASGDELLSSDIDQGDSSGSSPPDSQGEGQLAPRGRGWWRCEEEEDVATQPLVSRFQREPAGALGARQQAAGTSPRSEAPLAPGSGAAPPGQCSPLPGSAASRDEMQRLLQGPAPRPPGEPPQSPESPDRTVTSQRSPNSPGAPPRSPGRKKRRAVGSKGGGCLGAPGPAAPQLGSPLRTELQPEGGPGAGTAKPTAGTRQVKPQPDSAGASEPGCNPPEGVAGPGPGSDLSAPVPITEQGTGQTRMTPRAELHTESPPVREAHPDVGMAKPDVAVSTPACKPQPNMALATPASKPQPDVGLSTPVSKPRPDTALSTPASKPQPDIGLSTPASKPQPDTGLSTPVSKPQPDMALSTPASKPQLNKAQSPLASTPRLHMALPAAGPEVKTEVAPSGPVGTAVSHTALPHVPEADSDVGVSTPAVPSWSPVPRAEPAIADTEVIVPLEGHQEKPGGEPSAGAPGSPLGERPAGPTQAPKRKKVRFSMAGPSPEELRSAEATSSPSPAAARPSTPRTAAGGHGGSAAWDAVAFGPRAPQPRILKHLPPPAPSASVGLEPGSCFAMTLPEAYEFFFCNTIEEEDEDAEDEAADSQALGEVQWPDTCEFFFRDHQAPKPRRQGGRSPAPPLRGEPVPAAPPGEPVPISFPEAYEHFFGEDGLGNAQPPATIPQPVSVPLKEGWPGAAPELGPATAEQLSLAGSGAGELRGPLTSFTFSQNDMCLVFVAFATWAVRTSDLNSPDAWKTVLLANIGTISAIRYFRRRARRGHSPSPSPSPNPSRSPSRSPSPSPSPGC